MICVLCDEPVDTWPWPTESEGPQERWVQLNPVQTAHNSCALRQVVGGIGHQLAHEYWCLEKHDPDAGLTYHQSAQMVMALAHIIGVDEVSIRGVV